MAEPTIPDEFDSLPLEEQIEYVHRLWDRIASPSAPLPLPEWHRDVIRDRLAAHRKHPERAAPWPEVRAQIEEALRKRRG